LAQDFFAPLNAPTLDAADNDLGSGGTVGLPSAYFGTASSPHLLIVGGKEGWLYLLDRDRLGGFRQAAAGGDDILSRYGKFNGIFGRVAVWSGDGGYVYLAAEWDTLRCFQYRVTSGKPTLVQVAMSPQSFNFGSSSPLVTSNGVASGSALVWMISATGTLYAWDALPQGSSLILRYSSGIGTASKFLSPSAARDLIFVGTSDGHVLAYGAPVVTLTLTKNSANNAVRFAWSGGIAPYTLRQSPTARFNSSVTTLLDHQAQSTFEDPTPTDLGSYFYLVN
jgi:iron transport multicopper oxidase